MSLPRRGRRFLRVLLLVVVPVLAVAAALHFYAEGGRYIETENAYVKAHIIVVNSEVSGQVAQVYVRDNQPVEKGQLLFKIDAVPYETALARANAQLANARTDVETLRAEYRVAQAEAQEAEERIGFLQLQLDRQRRLREKGMVREDAFDEARHNLAAARAHVVALKERSARALTGLSGNPELPVERHPRVIEAQTARAAAALDLAKTSVHAPAAGTVSNMRLQAGEFLGRGVAAFSLIQSGDLWIEANFKETQLTDLRVGQKAQVIADAYPAVEWGARVATIAPATGAEFALLPPQNATGNWVKVVQRVPVLLAIEPEGGDKNRPALRAGMTVGVRIDSGHSRGLPDLRRMLGF